MKSYKGFAVRGNDNRPYAERPRPRANRVLPYCLSEGCPYRKQTAAWCQGFCKRHARNHGLDEGAEEKKPMTPQAPDKETRATDPAAFPQQPLRKAGEHLDAKETALKGTHNEYSNSTHNEYSNSKQIHNRGKKRWFDEVTEYSEDAYVAMDTVIPLKPATMNLPHMRSDLASTICYSDASDLLVETLQEARDACEIKRRTRKSQPAAAAATMSAMLRRLDAAPAQ